MGISTTLKKRNKSNRYELMNLVLGDGNPIFDNKVYKIVINDFLADGGDDFRSLTEYFIKI